MDILNDKQKPFLVDLLVMFPNGCNSKTSLVQRIPKTDPTRSRMMRDDHGIENKEMGAS